MSSLLPIVLLTAAVAGHAPVSHARQPQGSRPPRAAAPSPSPAPVLITASLASGWIEGLVTDDRHQPVAGAAVTAQGRDLLIIETDRTGRFELRGIPAGTYPSSSRWCPPAVRTSTCSSGGRPRRRSPRPSPW
jgi:hypothetical protein